MLVSIVLSKPNVVGVNFFFHSQLILGQAFDSNYYWIMKLGVVTWNYLNARWRLIILSIELIITELKV